MTGLSGAGTRVLLIGTEHTDSPKLSDVPAVRTSLADLEQRLVDSCDVPPANIRVVLDPPDPVMLDAVIRATAAAATDVLLIYFVGHGLVAAGNELFLSTVATVDITKNRPASQALEFSAIPAALSTSTASTVLVVLDCCYSGRARLGSDIADGLLLVSATPWGPALVRDGAEHTVFTGALLQVLAAGDPNGPPLTTLARLTELLDRKLHDLDPHQPRIGIEFRGNAGRLVIANNHAHRQPEPEPPPDAGAADAVNPYLGLAAYEKDDASRFFGRTEMTAALTAAIAARATDLIVLTGASGVGKSSILGAGLLPLLDKGKELPGSETWRQVAFAPGPDPLAALRTELAGALRIPQEAVDDLLTDPTRLRETCAATPIAVVVDQFEDVFTHHLAVADVFIEELTALASVARLTVVCLRSDFLGRCLSYPALGPAARAAVEVTPMTPADLRAVIEKPAAQAGFVAGEDLVEIILSDAQPRSGRSVEVLPLLSHALMETWQVRRGRVLTAADYIRAGRIDKAVTKSADAVYAALDAAGKAEARQLFLALVPLDGELQRTGRVVALDDLQPDPQVLDVFVRARLLGIDRGTVFLIHDALLDAWKLLREWIDQYGAGMREWQRVRSRAAEWQARRHPSLLLSGPALDSALRLRDSGVRLNKPEEEYLHASKGRQTFTKRLKIGVAMGLVLLTAFSVVSGILAIDQRNRARASADEAAVRQLQLLGQIHADTNPRAALSFQLAAARIAPSDRNRAELARALVGSPFGGTVIMPEFQEADDAITAVALSPDGGLLAAADEIGHVALWRVEGHQLANAPVGRFRVRHVDDLRFDATGRTLVVFGYDYDRTRPVDQRERDVQWWDISDPARPALSRAGGGGTVALISADGTVGVRRTIVDNASVTTLVRVGEQVTEVARPDMPGRLLGFSKDNSMLVTGDDTGYVLWDTRDLASPVQLARFSTALPIETDPASFTMITGGPREFASFSADNRLVALTGRGAPVTLIDLADRTRPTALRTVSDTGPTGVIGPSATRGEFSPSGRTLTVGGSGAGVQIWDVRDPLHPHVERSLDTELTGQIRSLTYSADGRTLVSGGRGGRTTLWNLGGGTGIQVETEFEALGGDGYFSPDGMTLIVDRQSSLTEPEMLEVWRLTDPLHPVRVGRIPEQTDGTADVSMTRDGHLVAVRGADGATALWSLVDPADPVQVGSVATNSGIGLTYPNTHTMTVRMDHAGTTLAVERESQSRFGYVVQLWDITDPPRPRQLDEIAVGGSPKPVYTVSPDGRLLAAVTKSDSTGIWDIRGQDKSRLLAELPGAAGRVTVSADGRMLLKTSSFTAEKPATEVYDLTDPTVPELREVTQRVLNSSAFNLDPRILTMALGRDVMLAPTDNMDSTVLLPGHLGTVDALRLRLDGYLVSRDPRTVRVWDVRGALRTLLDPEAAACQRLGTAISEKDWRYYAPNLPYDNVCR
ncbi:caspase, EACC1-associated type [Nocardia beijingensis]|uniref:Caspase family protein n=1 Tax=Nocardia beijingensis TaxID=95162 RepID=A0ABW7W8Z1_9NOCA